MISIKSDSVPPVLLQYTPEVDFICKAMDGALHDFGLHAVLTSGMEGTHKRASKHYRGEAVDFRIVWKREQQDGILRALSGRLGLRGEYFLETDHLHVETT